MIFISYRKEDTQRTVDLLTMLLKMQFGDQNVFKDDADINPGDKWPERLQNELQARTICLAVIGKNWISALDQYGNRRIDDPSDWVRLELCSAFDANKAILVILADGAQMPSVEGLPINTPLREIPNIQSLPLRHGSDSSADLERIAQALERLGCVRCPKYRKGQYKVIAFDLDGTLIRGFSPFSWKLLWNLLGYSEQIRQFGAHKYHRGEWSYQQWCEWACEMFRKRGLTKTMVCELAKSLQRVKNLDSTLICLKAAGYKLGLISGGIDVFLDETIPNADKLFDYIYINRLQFDSAGVIAGVQAANFDFERKIDALRVICNSIGADLTEAVFVGEAFNDMAVLRRAGLGIAFAPVPDGIEDVATVIETWDLAYIQPYL